MVGFMKIFGYRAPETPVGWNISPEVQQLMGSLMTLGAVIASGLAGPLSWKLGRKMCLWLACGLCCASDAIVRKPFGTGATMDSLPPDNVSKI